MSEATAESEWSDAEGASTGNGAKLAARYACFLFGLLVNSFGVALITKAALGTSPISSIPYVLDLEFQPTFGQFTFVLNMLYIVVQIALLRREFRPIQLLQVAANFAFSAFIDMSMGLLSWLNPASVPAMLLSLAVGCCILGFGVAVEVAPDVIVVPGEGIVRAISSTLHKPFGSCKFCFDASLAGVAGCMSFAFFGYLNGLGIGTIVAAMVVGPIVNVVNKHVPLIDAIRGLCA